MRCCVGDGGWPSGVALQGEASSRLMLRWLTTVVVSDEEKAHAMRQVGPGRQAEANRPMKRRNDSVDIETGESKSPGQAPGGCLLTGQAVSGVKAARAWSAALAWNVGRPVSMLMAACVWPVWRTRRTAVTEGAEY